MGESFILSSSTEIESLVELQKDFVFPVSVESNIDSIVETGTTDEFNETINATIIETNDQWAPFL